MLYILTGDIQTGKTRWLTALMDELRNRGAHVYGITAPGVWVEPNDATKASIGDDGIAREKVGIDNVLWPQVERIAFARRRDLCDGNTGHAQSDNAQLGWAIDDAAIERVNEHFDWIGQAAARASAAERAHSLVVVDELGRLELLRGQGLTSALKLLDSGPAGSCEQALIVVREALLEPALERFASSWDEILPIGPTEEARADVLRHVIG